jgi:hypothetical protein
MRFKFRGILVVSALISVLVVPPAVAGHQQADCLLTLAGQTAPGGAIGTSPHGAFRNGSVLYTLRGDHLTTFDINDVGEVRVARQDRLVNLGATDHQGGVAYRSGYLYVVSEAGLEVFDLRTVRGGPTGTAPGFVSRTATPHYRRVAVNGNLLAALYPASDLPCVPGVTPGCGNEIDLWNISDPSAPALVGRIQARNTMFVAFEDIAFANGFLYATGMGGTFAFNVGNPAAPATIFSSGTRGEFLVTNGMNLIGIGQRTLIGVFSIGPAGRLDHFAVYTLPALFNHANNYRFHPQATFDEQNRLITMIDEINPMTSRPARTVAFNVFDLSVPKFEGSDPRMYESTSFTYPDEMKWDPIAVGPYVYVNGELSGSQAWGACGIIAGKLELGAIGNLPCGGAEMRGWVTSPNRIRSVELFLDNTSLGFARLGQERLDISSAHPVYNWAVNVNVDQVPRGERTFRVVATDHLGNSRQVHSQTFFFGGPGQNCSTRRRGVR